MPDETKETEPKLATLNDIRPPPGRSSRRAYGATIVVLSVVIVVLLIIILRPEKLDVYKTDAELEFADPVLAACVHDTATKHQWPA